MGPGLCKAPTTSSFPRKPWYHQEPHAHPSLQLWKLVPVARGPGLCSAPFHLT